MFPAFVLRVVLRSGNGGRHGAGYLESVTLVFRVPVSRWLKAMCGAGCGGQGVMKWAVVSRCGIPERCCGAFVGGKCAVGQVA